MCASYRRRALNCRVVVKEGKLACVKKQTVGIGVASAYTFCTRDVPDL